MRIIVIYVGLLLIACWRIPLSRKHVVVDTRWASPQPYAAAQVTTLSLNLNLSIPLAVAVFLSMQMTATS